MIYFKGLLFLFVTISPSNPKTFTDSFILGTRIFCALFSVVIDKGCIFFNSYENSRAKKVIIKIFTLSHKLDITLILNLVKIITLLFTRIKIIT